MFWPNLSRSALSVRIPSLDSFLQSFINPFNCSPPRETFCCKARNNSIIPFSSSSFVSLFVFLLHLTEGFLSREHVRDSLRSLRAGQTRRLLVIVTSVDTVVFSTISTGSIHNNDAKIKLKGNALKMKKKLIKFAFVFEIIVNCSVFMHEREREREREDHLFNVVSILVTFSNPGWSGNKTCLSTTVYSTPQ